MYNKTYSISTMLGCLTESMLVLMMSISMRVLSLFTATCLFCSHPLYTTPWAPLVTKVMPDMDSISMLPIAETDNSMMQLSSVFQSLQKIEKILQKIRISNQILMLDQKVEQILSGGFGFT